MKTWLLRLSVVLNLMVVVALTWAWLSRYDFIRAFIYPMHERKVSFFESYPVNTGDIVFLGDSITEGGEWAEMFPDERVKNRGIGGDITTGVLARLHQITAVQPAAIFIKIGTNDLTHGPELLSTSYSQYREIVNRIKAESPATRIYLQSLLPRDAEYKEQVEAYNSEIEVIARETGSAYIDLYSHFVDTDGSIRNTFSNDELHLHGAGYQLWQQLITPYLETIPPQDRGKSPSPGDSVSRRPSLG
jgi:lysophospholipase L1-like esterase